MDPGKRFDGQPEQPEFTPPGRLPDQSAGDGGSLRWFLALLGFVLLLGLLVVFVLPGLVERQIDPPVSPPGTTEPAPADAGPVDAAAETAAAEPGRASESDDARTAAENALQAYLELRARLELENVGAWGEPDWTRSAALADDGDRQFSQRRFPQAASAYTGGLELLQELADGKAQRYEAAMAEGGRALDADDSDTAIARYELALAIRAGDAAATQGLERARLRPGVLAFMAQGVKAEDDGDLATARSAYQQAVDKDADYGAAVESLDRVSNRLAELAFQSAMTRALAALDNGRLTEADRALQEASGIRPDDIAVRDARQRLAAARQASRLATLRRKADVQARAEDWKAAAALYRQALKVDRNAGFASDGLDRAQARARLHEQIDHYLERPSRLYSDEPLSNAGELLEGAAAAPAGEPKLANKLARLQKLVREAGTPLPVSLRSDGKTEVVIYHVGRLGRFDTHRLKLKPGDYTVVGTREGYRDVRKTLGVRPGQAGVEVVIRCEEPV
jgi:tetratricopeptide (TPR) repeat protein